MSPDVRRCPARRFGPIVERPGSSVSARGSAIRTSSALLSAWSVFLTLWRWGDGRPTTLLAGGAGGSMGWMWRRLRASGSGRSQLRLGSDRRRRFDVIARAEPSSSTDARSTRCCPRASTSPFVPVCRLSHTTSCRRARLSRIRTRGHLSVRDVSELVGATCSLSDLCELLVLYLYRIKHASSRVGSPSSSRSAYYCGG
jgi:hypothetical protein